MQPTPAPTPDTPAERDAKAEGIEAQRVGRAAELEAEARVQAAVVKTIFEQELYKLRWESRFFYGITITLICLVIFLR